jgi:hypothetical protein
MWNIIYGFSYRDLEKDKKTYERDEGVKAEATVSHALFGLGF